MSSSTDVQRELERTRARMSAELDALAYKLDVPARAKERIGLASRRARSAAPGAGDVQRTAEENPLGVVLGGIAVGFLAGMLLPQTRAEDEKLGPLADRVRDEAVASGREALQRGKVVAKQAAESAKETAQDVGRQQGQAAKQSAGRRAGSVAQDARR